MFDPMTREVIPSLPFFAIRDNGGEFYNGGRWPLNKIENEAMRFVKLTGYTMNIFIVGMDNETYVCSYSLKERIK